ncbi:hypothetical protein Q3O59_03535 [Alkalimonas delamerensis]|uniref:KTSC domain-containing protein n=1 Tax=Alkalimonas delamerensis TaxID=265981 RepID=A0ABT9GN77_9GAMM|nr:hypothetical protein [Alkalimonas delamerensis]MDP4528101.1 hypothetical protein [Alkalimonas delamerensis]
MAIAKDVSNVLAANISCHFFSDDSGVVFFNRLTGETLGLALDYDAFMALCLSKRYPETLQGNEIRQFEKMLAAPWKQSEQSDDPHPST